MELETRKAGQIIIVKPLNDNINASISTEFKSKMVDLINQGNNFVLLNLAQVDFIDSMGLGAIISILKTLELSQGQLAFCEVKPPIFNLFKITRLNQVFKIGKSEKDGIDLLSKEIKK